MKKSLSVGLVVLSLLLVGIFLPVLLTMVETTPSPGDGDTGNGGILTHNSSVVPHPYPILENGGFETGNLYRWSITDTGNGYANVLSGDTPDGNYYVRVGITGDYPIKVCSSSNPNKPYLYFYYRLGGGTTSVALINIKFWSPSGVYLGYDQIWQRSQGVTGWLNKSIDLRTCPKYDDNGQCAIWICVIRSGFGSMIIDFDGFMLTSASPRPDFNIMVCDNKTLQGQSDWVSLYYMYSSGVDPETITMDCSVPINAMMIDGQDVPTDGGIAGNGLGKLSNCSWQYYIEIAIPAPLTLGTYSISLTFTAQGYSYGWVQKTYTIQLSNEQMLVTSGFISDTVHIGETSNLVVDNGMNYDISLSYYVEHQGEEFLTTYPLEISLPHGETYTREILLLKLGTYQVFFTVNFVEMQRSRSYLLNDTTSIVEYPVTTSCPILMGNMAPNTTYQYNFTITNYKSEVRKIYAILTYENLTMEIYGFTMTTATVYSFHLPIHIPSEGYDHFSCNVTIYNSFTPPPEDVFVYGTPTNLTNKYGIIEMVNETVWGIEIFHRDHVFYEHEIPLEEVSGWVLWLQTYWWIPLIIIILILLSTILTIRGDKKKKTRGKRKKII